MKSYQREILICIIAIVATISAVWCFLGRMTKEKKVIQTDLYAMIDPAPSGGALIINRPAIFSKMILSQKEIRELFTRFIPEIYLSVIQQTPSLSTVIFSFHEQGIAMYTKADERLADAMDKQIFRKTFNTYSPQVQKKDGITFTYYPDAENHYWGFYQYGNIFVASYSKRLLEKAAERQRRDYLPSSPDGGLRLINSLDHHVPLNLIIPADLLNLYVQTNDSTEWRIQGRWITADMYAEKGGVCCIGTLPYHPSIDSLYAPLSDTLSIRLQELFPKLQIHSQSDIGKEVVYFTTCGKLTTNPS